MSENEINLATPSADQWGLAKEAICRIYINNKRNKNDMRSIMMLIYHFEPTLKMYNSKLSSWKLVKNKKGSPESPGGTSDSMLPRKRYDVKAAEKIFYALLDRSMPINPAAMRSPNIFKRQEAVLFSVYDYILEAFNKGGYEPSQLHDTDNPYTITWQNLSDKAYEVNVLLQRSCTDRAAEAFNWILRNIEPMAKSNHPSMMIKFWRVAYYLYRLGNMMDDHGHLYDFIRWFHTLAQAEHPSNHSIVQLLESLYCMDRDVLWYTLRIGYLRSIHCLQTVLKSNNNPIVLSMWANYAKHWGQKPGDSAAIVIEYERSLAEIKSQSPSNLEREIFVLHGFLYFAFYVAQDHSLSMRLSIQLLNTTTRFIGQTKVIEWRFEIQAFCLASKLIASLSKSGSLEDAAMYLTQAIMTLRDGDQECQTRALALIDELNTSYGGWNDMKLKKW